MTHLLPRIKIRCIRHHLGSEALLRDGVTHYRMPVARSKPYSGNPHIVISYFPAESRVSLSHERILKHKLSFTCHQTFGKPPSAVFSHCAVMGSEWFEKNVLGTDT